MIAKKIDRHRLILKYPASWYGNMWREALPSGNGCIGAAVYGGISEETILINHEDLWHLGNKDALPDVSYTLPKARKLMDDGQYKDAGWLLTNALKEKGYNTRLAAILPLADLRVIMPCKNAFKQYRRVLDMETGEVNVMWKEGENQYKRSLFVSRTDDLIAYEISCDEGLIDCEIFLTNHKSDNASSSQSYKDIEENVQVEVKGNYICYASKNDDNTDFGAVLRVITIGGVCTALDGGIRIKESEKVLVMLKVFVKSERNTECNKLKKELSNINKNYDELLKEHVIIHSKLFNSVSLELGTNVDQEISNEELLLEAYEGETPTTLTEKMWDYGRYLFISASHEGGNPVGMYGLWGGDYNLMWCHNMANENIQMIYWHTMVGGLSELSLPVFNYYDSLIDDFRENAKKLFGCRGICIPAGSTPGIGLPNQIVPVIMNWTSAAGWLARQYYEYYQYTQDVDFLRNRVLPFMREIVLFYEDFVVMDTDGFYKYYPSVSPENTPGNYYPTEGGPIAHPMPTTINSTMDIAIMKDVLTNLIKGSKIAKVCGDETHKWIEMLTHIPDYKINEDGAISEWIHPDFKDNYNHRHLSHIYPLFPGTEINKQEDPELFKAFDIAVKKRLIGAQTGWSFTHMASVYARLGRGDNALECLEILSRSCLLNNFYTLHNDWRNMGTSLSMNRAPVQMDANMGWVNAVQEMLLYSSQTLVSFLPARPKKWNKGKITDFRFCTGKVSFNWDVDSGLFTAKVKADRDTDILINLPEEFGRYEWYGDKAEISRVNNFENKLKVIIKAGGNLFIKTI